MSALTCENCGATDVELRVATIMRPSDPPVICCACFGAWYDPDYSGQFEERRVRALSDGQLTDSSAQPSVLLNAGAELSTAAAPDGGEEEQSEPHGGP